MTQTGHIIHVYTYSNDSYRGLTHTHNDIAQFHANVM